MTDFDPHMKTISGRRWHYLKPDPNVVSVNDIAWHLSMLCRFNGAVTHFYSVAQHSCLVLDEVARILGPIELWDADIERERRNTLMWALFHDGEEYVLGDTIGPVKQLLKRLFPEVYTDLPARTQAAINGHLGITGPEPDCVKIADKRLLATEQKYFTAPWLDGQRRTACDSQHEPIPGLVPRPWSPDESYWSFLKAFDGLSRWAAEES